VKVLASAVEVMRRPRRVCTGVLTAVPSAENASGSRSSAGGWKPSIMIPRDPPRVAFFWSDRPPTTRVVVSTHGSHGAPGRLPGRETTAGSTAIRPERKVDREVMA
jgi:hypothetical protein